MRVASMVDTVAILLLLITLSGADDDLFPQHSHRLVCHMSFEDGKFTVADAETALPMCTHLVYNSLRIDNSTFQVYSVNPTRDFGEEGISRMVGFKKKFPNLKTMIGVGGQNDSENYSQMARKPENRAVFVATVVDFVLENNLDGADLYWFQPGSYGGDRLNFILLLKEMRQFFDKHLLLLSVSLPGSFSLTTFSGIDPLGVSEHVHFLNLRSFHYKELNTVTHLAPYSISDKSKQNVFSIQHFYKSGGVPSRKINIGITSNYVAYLLHNVTATGDVIGVPYKTRGFISELRFCKWKEEGGWMVTSDVMRGTAHSWKEDVLIGHENGVSLVEKVNLVGTKKDLGGIAYYGLNFDDYGGECAASEGKYPVLRKINELLVDASQKVYDFLINKETEKYGYNARFYWNDRNETVWDKDKEKFN